MMRFFIISALYVAATETILNDSITGVIGHVKAEYMNQHVVPLAESSSGSSSVYVFLQRFPLQNSGGLFFHTEVLVCPRENFSIQDQMALDDSVASLIDFVEVEESWWSTRTSNCVELGYGGSSCTQECCSVPHGPDQVKYPLNARRAMINNVDLENKSVYLYGIGDFDGEVAYQAVCDHKCWSGWSGTDYNPFTNNCNTFTSTVLSCVYRLSEKKPHLGPSDIVSVKCRCHPYFNLRRENDAVYF